MVRICIFLCMLFYSFFAHSGSEEDLYSLQHENVCIECDFSEFDLSKLDFQHSNLSSSNFDGAILNKSYFQNSNLSNSSFINS